MTSNSAEGKRDALSVINTTSITYHTRHGSKSLKGKSPRINCATDIRGATGTRAPIFTYHRSYWTRPVAKTVTRQLLVTMWNTNTAIFLNYKIYLDLYLYLSLLYPPFNKIISKLACMLQLKLSYCTVYIRR